MQPRDIVRLDPTAFLSETSCLGEQLVRLLRLVHGLRPDLKWYVADVQTIGPFPVHRREATPILIGDTGTLIEAAKQVNQFESGVFAGVPSAIEQPAFRAGGLWTEDGENADLGDAVVEVRAFDTSYWLMATADANLAGTILERLARQNDRNTPEQERDPNSGF